jgi:transcriptional regulator with XRE-family HTH domain
MPTMGDRLKWCRKQFGWTQLDLSRESGVGIATIRRIEQLAYEPKMETARRLAGPLHVREGWLAFGEEPMVSPSHMTGNEQIRAHTGPGTEGLPGFVVVQGGPWFHDGEGWTVDHAAITPVGNEG